MHSGLCGTRIHEKSGFVALFPDTDVPVGNMKLRQEYRFPPEGEIQGTVGIVNSPLAHFKQFLLFAIKTAYLSLGQKCFLDCNSTRRDCLIDHSYCLFGMAGLNAE